MKLQDTEECFEIEMGTPTLTLELSGEQRMVGYSGFRDAVMKSGGITVRFRDWIVIINGENLSFLWRQLQMQDVRLIRVNKRTAEGDCVVTQIQITEIEEHS